MPIKVKNSFDMPKLRRRAKRVLRRKYKKTIKLSDVDKIWADYFKYGILKPLLKFGNVKIDDRTTFEIIGTKLDNDNTMLGLMSKGINYNGIVKEAVKFNPDRRDVKYKTVLTDKNFNGQVIFEPNHKLSKAVHNELLNTTTYYRIKR
jgi:hypothetical protein